MSTSSLPIIDAHTIREFLHGHSDEQQHKHVQSVLSRYPEFFASLCERVSIDAEDGADISVPEIEMIMSSHGLRFDLNESISTTEPVIHASISNIPTGAQAQLRTIGAAPEIARDSVL